MSKFLDFNGLQHLVGVLEGEFKIIRYREEDVTVPAGDRIKLKYTCPGVAWNSIPLAIGGFNIDSGTTGGVSLMDVPA